MTSHSVYPEQIGKYAKFSYSINSDNSINYTISSLFSTRQEAEVASTNGLTENVLYILEIVGTWTGVDAISNIAFGFDKSGFTWLRSGIETGNGGGIIVSNDPNSNYLVFKMTSHSVYPEQIGKFGKFSYSIIDNLSIKYSIGSLCDTQEAAESSASGAIENLLTKQ